MRHRTSIAIVLCLTVSPGLDAAFGRGFGGFHGGGFGGGGLGEAGLGGGGFHAGGLGGGGLGGVGLGGAGGFRSSGLGGGLGGGFGAGELGGGLGAGGLGAIRGGSGVGAGSLGGVRGGAGSLGEGLGDGGSRDSLSQRGGLGEQGLAGGLQGLNLDGKFGGLGGAAPSVSRLNSFLGLPTDSGLSAASGRDYGMSYSGSARGLSAYDASAAGGAYAERGFAAGPEGVAAGRAGAAGHVYEGPAGTEVAHGTAGAAGAAVGPEGAAAGGRAASATVVKGPEGGVYAHGEAVGGGIAAGPSGVAGGARAASGTVIKGPEGGVYAHGAVAGGGFYSGARATGTWQCSAADMRVQGNYVRSGFDDYGAFDRNWYARYPGAWYARGYAAGAWSHCTWSTINSWFGTTWPAIGYSYGDDITYENNDVYLYGRPIATAADYYQSALELAQTGEQADVPVEQLPQNEEQAAPTDQASTQWLSLGVFEGIPPNEKSSRMLFQLAVNHDGIVRGNYYNTGDHNVQQIQGALDKQTQRVTWVVADRKNIIFDTGLYNLTKDETTVLVHEGPDKTQQWMLVRLTQPAGSGVNQ